MGLLELCEEVFGTADLYRVLGVRREASEGEVRRGYHKVSLLVHPDRAGEGDKEDATRRFQILGKVYSVLSDKEQRAVYDEQGTVDEDSAALSQDRDWEAYWRLLFKKISLEDIQAFEKTYKGSEEELADIKQAYLDFKGDMDQIMESVLCVQYTEEPRIRNIIQQAIDAREVPSYNAFVKESKQKMNARKRRAQEEAKEAEISRKELGLDEGMDNLKAAIQIPYQVGSDEDIQLGMNVDTVYLAKRKDEILNRIQLLSKNTLSKFRREGLEITNDRKGICICHPKGMG
ncbi:DnaJ like protein subfamily C member 9 [Tupaia chinensis]|uniref:DnaJ homolog subfamily C member 9 n=1 Tax=Tupaia chinensis TaxID=246437 RepID=L8Y4W0_TUPCH|nr:DnaJ like protein subfamily C member 9 [Tupaia chinensis]